MNGLNILIFLLLLSSSNLYSQDSTWKKMKIDENLTISFPRIVSQMDTTFVKEGKEMRFRAIKSETEFSALALLITPTETNANVDNEESLQKTLTEMAEGSLKAMSENGIECVVTDTIIDDIICKKLIGNTNVPSTIISYIFLVNDKMYSLQGVFLNKSTAISETNELNQALKSVHFNKTLIKEKQFGSKAESLGYKIGKMIIPLLIVIGVIVFIVKKA
jgi:hypothetical protein